MFFTKGTRMKNKKIIDYTYQQKREMIESGQHLASFAFDEDSNVRFVVAKYTKDKEIIELLSKDKNEAVRYMIALMSDNETLLSRMANDSSSFVRTAVAQSTKDTALLDYLAKDENVSVRTCVAGNSHTSYKAQAKLAFDSDVFVRVELARNTCYENLLSQLADDTYKSVRNRVAEQTNNPVTLHKLMTDKEEYVSAVARFRLSLLLEKTHSRNIKER